MYTRMLRAPALAATDCGTRKPSTMFLRRQYEPSSTNRVDVFVELPFGSPQIARGSVLLGFVGVQRSSARVVWLSPSLPKRSMYVRMPLKILLPCENCTNALRST